MTDAVYLDYNATTPLRPEVRDAIVGALDHVGNPSSVHRFGRTARRMVEDARERVGALAGVAPTQVIFTGGGTEANNMVLRCVPATRRMVSAIEHDSVLQAAADADLLPVSADGVLDLASLDRMLAEASGTVLVSVMLANNETGVIQPVADIARICRAHGALLHCDAVQAAGRIAIDCALLDVDFLSLSAHKLGGPQGVGALVLRGDRVFDPLLRGGGQERRRRAGTENVAGIAGFGCAAELAVRGLGDQDRVAALRDAMEDRLRTAVPDAGIHGAGAPRLPNTCCVSMPGVPSETQLMALDLAGIAVSAGSACSSGKVKASHVLLAMGVGEEEAGSALRVSLGWATGPADTDRFVEAWTAVHRRTHRPAS